LPEVAVTEPVLPKTFSGATKVSAAVVGLLALFIAGLFVFALLNHMDRRTLVTTGAGTLLLAVFTAVQLRTIRDSK
jgi:Na+/citrate or Na+/malate symporter